MVTGHNEDGMYNAIGGDVSNDDGCCNGGFDSRREIGYPRNTAFAGAIRQIQVDQETQP